MEILLLLTLMLFFRSSNCCSQGVRSACEVYILKQLIVCNALHMMPFANDGRGSCLWADRYYRLNNMGVVTWLMWIFSCNLTSVSYFTEVGELFQLAKSSGCANRQNPGEWEFEGCVNYKFRCVLLCINTQCQKPLLRGVVYVNCEGRCCCSSCSNP